MSYDNLFFDNKKLKQLDINEASQKNYFHFLLPLIESVHDINFKQKINDDVNVKDLKAKRKIELLDDVSQSIPQIEEKFQEERILDKISELNPGAKTAIYSTCISWGLENSLKTIKSALFTAELKGIHDKNKRSDFVVENTLKNFKTSESTKDTATFIHSFYNEELKKEEGMVTETQSFFSLETIEDETEQLREIILKARDNLIEEQKKQEENEEQIKQDNLKVNISSEIQEKVEQEEKINYVKEVDKEEKIDKNIQIALEKQRAIGIYTDCIEIKNKEDNLTIKEKMYEISKQSDENIKMNEEKRQKYIDNFENIIKEIEKIKQENAIKNPEEYLKKGEVISILKRLPIGIRKKMIEKIRIRKKIKRKEMMTLLNLNLNFLNKTVKNLKSIGKKLIKEAIKKIFG